MELEEPPSKVLKCEVGEVTQEEHNGCASPASPSQEEWLSESMLTDEEINAHQATNIENQSQDGTLPSMEDSTEQMDTINMQSMSSIEQSLTNMEKENEDHIDEEDVSNLSMFLVRKDDGSVVQQLVDERGDSHSEAADSPRNSRHGDDDAQDTDELLSILGEKSQKKEILKTSKRILQKQDKSKMLAKPENFSDNDIFEGPKILQYKVAKNAVVQKLSKTRKKQPIATSDASSDEEVPPRNRKQPRSNNTSVTEKRKNVTANASKTKTSTANQSGYRSVLRSQSKVGGKKETDIKMNKERDSGKVRVSDVGILQQDNVKANNIYKVSNSNIEDYSKYQVLMKPEQMDEEFISDEDSESSHSSFFDDVPTSDSDEVEDWFTLDIREERAAEYIPLLGKNAHNVLLEERERVESKLTSLRENIGALSEKSKIQSKEIEEARRTLKELEALLIHT